MYRTPTEEHMLCVSRAIKSMAKTRGELYFEEALKYEALGDYLNAQATAVEGLRLCMGPFYLAVRDQLQDLLDRVKPWTAFVITQYGVQAIQCAHA
jgi:hypothetical protein